MWAMTLGADRGLPFPAHPLVLAPWPLTAAEMLVFRDSLDHWRITFRSPSNSRAICRARRSNSARLGLSLIWFSPQISRVVLPLHSECRTYRDLRGYIDSRDLRNAHDKLLALADQVQSDTERRKLGK